MFNEKVIASLVNASVKNVLKSETEPITKEQLNEAITKSISSCLLSMEFLDYIDEQLGKRMERVKRDRGIR